MGYHTAGSSQTRSGCRLASRVECLVHQRGQSGHLDLPSMAVRQASAFFGTTQASQVGLPAILDASKYEAGRWICLPSCQSPDVSLASHAAPCRFPFWLAGTALRNGRNGHIGHLSTPHGVQPAGAGAVVAAPATCCNLHSYGMLYVTVCILPSSSLRLESREMNLHLQPRTFCMYPAWVANNPQAQPPSGLVSLIYRLHAITTYGYSCLQIPFFSTQFRQLVALSSSSLATPIPSPAEPLRKRHPTISLVNPKRHP